MEDVLTKKQAVVVVVVVHTKESQQHNRNLSARRTIGHACSNGENLALCG
jgi:hypothetical protein